MANIEYPKHTFFLDAQGNIQLDWAVFLERLADDAQFQVLERFNKANLPTSQVPVGAQVYVNDETGGAVPAFWDGTNWRRVTDRAVVS